MNYRQKLLPLLLSLTTVSSGGIALAADYTAPGETGVHIDQVGYLTNYSKTALVNAAISGDDFALVDTANGQTVFSGKLSAAKLDQNSQENLRTADFSAVTTPGTYKLKVGSTESYPFAIGDNVYADAAEKVWRSYTLTRCNQPIDDSAVTGLKLKGGHPQDEEAIVYFTDETGKKGDILDLSGGWYDAGDYGKYIPTAAIATAQMMMAYEVNPDHFTIGQLHFPIGVATDKSLPDGLSEVKYELDWMRKMQRSDGSTFHKVAAIQWNGDVSPDDDHLPRYALGTNTYGTAMYGGALAMASRVYAQYNANYAKGLLQDAVFAWDYLEKHPDRIFRFDEGQDNGSGNYNTDTDENQRLWLAAELFRSTGDKKYEQYIMNNGNKLMTEKPCMFGWGNTQALAQFAYLNTAAADPEYKAKVKSAFLATADEILTKIKQDGFNCALSPWEYCWASTKGDVTQGNFLLMANEIQPNKAYVDGALAQVHYLLGRNSLDRSFLTGIGSNPPKHAHSRIMGSTGVLIPGLMVGGPNQYEGGDPEQTALVKGKNLPPAKCYVDSHGSWSTNEYAIDYTATAAYALAWFVKPAADK